MLRQVVFALLLLFAAAFDAAALEYTDVYFNPETAGRGFFLVQSEGFQFIALFIQGPDGKPTWYTAELTLTADGKSYLKDQTMAAVEAALDPARFVRIHRSYLLNIERIARVELYAKDSRIAILRDGRKLPVSRAGYQRLAKLL